MSSGPRPALLNAPSNRSSARWRTPPALYATRAVLPHPPRDLSPKEAARIRGLADQMALWLSHHDKAAHARFKPASQRGAAAFEAIEQARVEAIGANVLSRWG